MRPLWHPHLRQHQPSRRKKCQKDDDNYSFPPQETLIVYTQQELFKWTCLLWTSLKKMQIASNISCHNAAQEELFRCSPATCWGLMGPVFLRNDSPLSKAMIGSSGLSISDFSRSLLWLGSWMISSKWDASPFADRPFSCLEVWTPLTTRTDRLQKKTDGLNEWFKWTTTNVIYVKNLNNRQHNLWIKQCLHPMCSRKQDCHLWVNWQNRKTQTQDLPFVHAILFQCRAWLVVGSC